MGYPLTLRLDCQFCGATRDVKVNDGAEFKQASADWYHAHKPCAKGEDIKLRSSGQRDDGTVDPILTAVFKGEKGSTP